MPEILGAEYKKSDTPSMYATPLPWAPTTFGFLTVKVQVLNLAFAVVDVNPENFRKSPVFSKSAAAVAADPHGLNS